jgi:hypothetical protein
MRLMNLVFAACTALVVASHAALAQGQIAGSAPAGAYAAPEQVPCQDCLTHRCVLVPETKPIKKIVYEVHEVPYCLKKLPPLFSFHKHGCDECAECDCVRYKKVLVKKEVVCGEICTTKCVPEPCVVK